MPVREGGRIIRDARGKEKREGGTRQDRTEGEIPKGHPAAAKADEAKAAAVKDAKTTASAETSGKTEN